MEARECRLRRSCRRTRWRRPPRTSSPQFPWIFRNYAKNEMFSILIYNVYQVQTSRFVNNNTKHMLHDHREREYIWTNWEGWHSASFSPNGAVVLHNIYRFVTITGPASAFVQFTFVPKLHFSSRLTKILVTGLHKLWYPSIQDTSTWS